MTLDKSIPSAMLIAVVFFWGTVWTVEVQPAFGLPLWVQALFNAILFVFISRQIWRGA